MTALRASRFTMVERLPSGTLGIFDTLTRAMAVLPESVWNDAVRQGPDQDRLKSELVSQGFLVADDVDDSRVLSHLRRHRTYAASRLTFTIGLDTRCSRGCPGCRHAVEGPNLQMTPATASAVLDFIQLRVKDLRPERITLEIQVFGSTDRLRVLNYLNEGFNRFAQGGGLAREVWVSSCVYNEFPLEALALQPAGLNGIRPIVGGPAQLPDRLESAGAVADGLPGQLTGPDRPVRPCRITPALQIHPADAGSSKALDRMERLFQKGTSRSKIEVRFGLDSLAGFIPGPIPWSCLSEPSVDDAFSWRKALIERGFAVRPGPPETVCPANNLANWFIDPIGRLKICPLAPDAPSFLCGNVWSGADFRAESRRAIRPGPDECRRECPLAPLCDGGCRLEAYFKDHDFEGVICNRPVLEEMVRSYIRSSVP